MVIFSANKGNSSFDDYTSTGKGVPTLDTTKDLKQHPDHSVDWDETNGLVTVFARRSLETDDDKDYVI